MQYTFVLDMHNTLTNVSMNNLRKISDPPHVNIGVITANTQTKVRYGDDWTKDLSVGSLITKSFYTLKCMYNKHSLVFKFFCKQVNTRVRVRV